VPALEKLVSGSSLRQARLHALWSLQGLNALSDSDILAGLSDPVAGVRENAVVLGEPRLDQSPALLEKVLALADDPDARVRFQVAFSLGETKDPRAVEALTHLAREYGHDYWMRTAVLSSVAASAEDILIRLIQENETASKRSAIGAATKVAPEIFDQLTFITGVRHRPQALEQVLDGIAVNAWLKSQPEIEHRFLVGIGSGLKRAGARFDLKPASAGPGTHLLADRMAAAQKRASDSQAIDERRRQAIQLLGCAPFSFAAETLKGLLEPQRPQSVQVAAIQALSDFSEPAAIPALLAPWRSYTPDVRLEVVRAMLAREDRTLAFLQAAQRGDVSIAQLELGPRALLLKQKNETIRNLADLLFGRDAPSPRNAVIADYKSALRMKADPVNGEKIFEKNCMTCHQLGPRGHTVGPNLAASNFRDPDNLLIHILDPNLYVPPNYIQYLVADKQGRTYTGVIASQTATSIALKHENDATDTILRSDIEEMTSTGKSMMPEGLEKQISKQEMADLLAFLVNAINRYATDDADIRARDHGTDPGLIEPDRK
jgi:putative heme-binding domain-containing protein